MVMLLLFAAFVRLCMPRLLYSLALAVSVEAGILFTHFVWNFKHFKVLTSYKELFIKV